MRKFGGVVEDVTRDGVDTVGKACFFSVLFGDCGLTREVDDGNLDILVVLATGDCPFGGISADIKQVLDRLFEYNGEGVGKGLVRIEMVKAEPALFLLICKLR